LGLRVAELDPTDREAVAAVTRLSAGALAASTCQTAVFVIPGQRASAEPGIHSFILLCGPMDSGLTLRAPRNDTEMVTRIASHITLRSRGAFCVRALLRLHPLRWRAQGRPGADRTHGPRATRKHAAEPQVTAQQPAFPAR